MNSKYLIFILFIAATANSQSAPPLEWVLVDNPGNADDPLTGKGAVGYPYSIMKHEVTNDQYVEFLNAVAQTDINGLYSTMMESDPRGGIVQSGKAGRLSYRVKKHMGNKPVVWVSWFDAIRYCNWLHNGKPKGAQNSHTTEDGAYVINAGTVVGTRKPGALYFLPSEDEWYKAAYFDPNRGGRGVAGYWLYPTRSNTQPTPAKADNDGDISNPGPNVANWLHGAKWNGQNGNVTTVGSAGPQSESAFGTRDMAGNVYEYPETQDRGRCLKLGSAWDGTPSYGPVSTARHGTVLSGEDYGTGFRVAKP